MTKRGAIDPAITALMRMEVHRFGEMSTRLLSVPVREFGVSVLHESLPSLCDTPAILHKRTAEFVFVLSGQADAYLDGRHFRIRKGDMFQIPAGVGHRFKAGKNGVTALSLFCPPLDRDRPDVYSAAGQDAGKRYESPFKTRGKSK